MKRRYPMKRRYLNQFVLLLILGLAGCSSFPLGERSSLGSLQREYRRVAEGVLPVVVEIRTEASRPRGTADTPWPYFFPEPGEEPPEPGEERGVSGLGSGIIVEQRGKKVYVVTNNHVIGDAEEISVRLSDGREFPSELVGRDERKDIALLSFQTEEPIPTAEVGDSDNLRPGDIVFAVGSPYGLSSTITNGIVSAVKRRGGPGDNISDFIQTDASINQGNSGGALVDIEGKVVGINTWITSPTGGNIGLGFSIPINNIRRSLQGLMAEGAPRYGWLGVSLAPAPDGQPGSLVWQIFKGSPADTAGIQPGDIILSLNGERVEDYDALIFLVGEIPPGEVAELGLLRQDKRVQVEAVLGKRGDEAFLAAQAEKTWPGFIVEETGAEELQVVRVYPKTAAQKAGLHPEDRIISLNGVKIKTLFQFYRQLNDTDTKKMDVTIRRGEETRELSFGLDAAEEEQENVEQDNQEGEGNG